MAHKIENGNLADIKRKLCMGQAVVMTYAPFMKNNKIGVKRYVVKVQTNGVYFGEKNSLKGSWFEFPKATLIEKTEKGFRTYTCGRRILTPAEQAVIDARPRDEEQEKVDQMSDTNTMFYRNKQYLKEKGMPWLDYGVSKFIEGKKRADETHIWDETIKGDLELEYEFVEGE